MISLEFLAIGNCNPRDGWRRGRAGQSQYNASFTIDFDQTKVTDKQVNEMIQEQIKLFKSYHPTAQIVQQRQIQY